jgi:hypothetical protein
MKRKVKIFTVLFFTISNLVGYSQTDSILNKQVEVIKAYQPTISDANKIITSPKINDTIKYSPVFEYKIKSTLVPVSKSIQNLPVVKLGNPPNVKGNTGFLKAGFGNGLTPYGEFVLNTNPSRTTDFGIQLYHFSSSPKIKLTNGLKIKSPYSDNLARIFVKNYFSNAVLDWSLQYERNRFNYYGFPGLDSLLYRESENISTTLNKKQIFNNATASFNLRKINARTDFNYDVTLAYNYFWNATGQKSQTGSYDGRYTISKQNFNIELGSEIDYISQDSVQNSYTQVYDHQFLYAGISPQIVFERKSWILKAGLNLSTLFDDDTSAIFHISPKIDFAYTPIKNILTIFAGTDGCLSTNNYQSMTLKNRYFDYSSEVMPSQDLIKLFGGFRGKFSRNISYLFDVAYTIKSNEPFFYLKQTNYPSASDQVINTFSVKYDDLNVLRFGGNIRYSSENVTIALLGNYYSYKTGNNSTITHLPGYDASLETSVQVTSQIKCKVGAAVIGSRKGEIEITTHNTDPKTGLLSTHVLTTENPDLKTIIDINLGAEYSYTKKLNFFLDVKNLINQNYEIWHGYNSQGILVMAGARYTF